MILLYDCSRQSYNIAKRLGFMGGKCIHISNIAVPLIYGSAVI